jgi:hypothetical protein
MASLQDLAETGCENQARLRRIRADRDLNPNDMDRSRPSTCADFQLRIIFVQRCRRIHTLQFGEAGVDSSPEAVAAVPTETRAD